MRTLCPACRSELSPGYAVCFGCGAILAEGHRNLSGRPLRVLLTRWLVLASWLATAMAPVYAMLPSYWGAALLGSMAGGAGLLAALAAVFAQCPRGAVLGLIQGMLGAGCGMMVAACEEGVMTEIVGAFIGALAAVVLALPAIHFWMGPLKPSDPWRCRRCGYSLYGLTTPRCPECGTSFHRSGLHWLRWGKPPPDAAEDRKSVPAAPPRAAAATKPSPQVERDVAVVSPGEADRAVATPPTVAP